MNSAEAYIQYTPGLVDDEGNVIKTVQDEIWAQAIAATRDTGYQPVAMLILPAISRMISVSTERTIAVRMHPPTIIFVMLGGLVLIGALLAGYGMASRNSRNWLHALAFVAILALTVYVIGIWNILAFRGWWG